MSKKTIIILFIILLVVALNVIGYVFIYQNKGVNTSSSTANQVLNSLFPVGGPSVSPNNPSASENNAANLPAYSSTATVSTNETPNNNGSSHLNVTGLSLLPLTNTGNRYLYLDKGTGNIYQMNSSEQTAIRLTYTTITEIGESYWGQDKNGSYVVLRHLNDNYIENLIGQLPKNFSTSSEPVVGELKLKTLSSNVMAFAVSPKKDKVFSLEARVGGVDGSTSNFDFKTKNKIWGSPLGDWLVSWPAETVIALTTKPTANLPGSLYFLNPVSKNFEEILGSINGLTTLVSPDGQKIIYSQSGAGSFNLYLDDLKQKKITRLGINTLPEKCVWVDNNWLYCAVPKRISFANYPDDWYQGKVQFSDDIWKIDTQATNSFLVASNQNKTDYTQLTFDPKTGRLAAIDRNTNYLQVWETKTTP